MSRGIHKKIVAWESYQPPLQWKAILECGHPERSYCDDPITDEDKIRIEASGNTSPCYECGYQLDRIADLEGQLREAKQRLSDPTKVKKA